MASIDEVKEKVREILKGRTTGLTGAELREAADSIKATQLMYAVTAMRKSGELDEHGETPRNKRFTLNPDFLTDGGAAPKKKRKKAKKARKARKTAGRRAPRAPAAPEAGDFIAALTADRELVLIDESGLPRVLDAARTQQVAALMLANFEA